jgi:acyl-CoA thioester hydrolase
MKTYPKVLASKTKIRFQHCDPFNHLNNGNYTDYFMNHREDVLLKYYDIDIYKIAKTTRKSWVSSSNQIVYIKPASLMETVTITSQLINFNESELIVEMCMFNEDRSQLKSIIWCSFVHFNLLKQKREKHSEDFMNLFKTIKHTIKESTFEERLKNFRTTKINSK